MTSYLSHDSNARNDDKILALRYDLGWEGYGLYWGVIEMLREASACRIRATSVKGVAMTLCTDPEKLNHVLFDYGLFETETEGDELFVYSASLRRRMAEVDKRSNTRRQAARSRWNQQSTPASDANAMQMQCKPDANAMQVSEPVDANAMLLNKIKLNKMKSYYSSSYSFLTSEPEETKEEQQQKICIDFFFRNWTNPIQEFNNKFLPWNNSADRSWDDCTPEQRYAAAAQWKQKPAQKDRFPKDFLALWHEIVWNLWNECAPENIIMDAVSDSLRMKMENGCLTIGCSQDLYEYLEDCTDESKADYVSIFKQHLGTTRLQYVIVNPK